LPFFVYIRKVHEKWSIFCFDGNLRIVSATEIIGRQGGGASPLDTRTHGPKIEWGPRTHEPKDPAEHMRWSIKIGCRRLPQAKKRSFFWWRWWGTTSSGAPPPTLPIYDRDNYVWNWRFLRFCVLQRKHE
jgi:hypothetical protein